jgi:Lon-like protease
MPRRTATLLASTLLFIALLCVGVLMPVPYAELGPGPTVNTLGTHGGSPVLQISGHRTYPTTGHLNMTTVRVTGADYRMNLVESVIGWLAHDEAVVPRETLYPDDKSAQEVDQENAEEFSQSQESAKVAALHHLGIPVGSRVIVGSVVKGAPAQGRLHAGDVLRAVDGKPVSRLDDVASAITRHKPGQKVVFTVVPAADAKGKSAAATARAHTRNVTVTTMKAQDDGRAVVGIQPKVEHTFPFRIDIKLADVGGPSAGLMFSLGLIDKMEPGELTGGRFVAGTGTIDDNGEVGPIGGIQMKIIAADRKGAQYFLTPADNCSEAVKDKPSGITLVKVHTLDDALAALKQIRTVGPSAVHLPGCTS